MKITSITSSNETKETTIKLDYNDLMIASTSGDYFSYSYGTAAIILKDILLTKYNNKINYSIEIINYNTTLPMKKGLSSSAAVCVTIAKCFNILFDLNFDMQTIMEIAYQGERCTLSKCGRMDQSVAAGQGAIGLMEFDGNACNMSVLRCKAPLYFVVADLKAGKNTIKILEALNECFPFPSNETKALMHKYVSNNHQLIWKSVKAIEEGDIHSLANAMNDAQAMFDKCAIDQCPSELQSPKLHLVINHQNLRSVSLAIKGVGSQGDGSVQILCADREMQEKALKILETELDCEGFPLTVPSSDTNASRPLRCINRIRFAIVVLDPKTLQRNRLSIFSNVSILTDTNKQNYIHLLQELIASGIEKIIYVIPAYQDDDNVDSTTIDNFFSNLFLSNATEWTYKDYQLELIKARTHFIYQQQHEDVYKSIDKAVKILSESNDNIENEKILICKGEVMPSKCADQGIKKIINVSSTIGNSPMLLAINKVASDEVLRSDRLYLDSTVPHTTDGSSLTSVRLNVTPTPDAVCEGLMIFNLKEASKCLSTITSELTIETTTLHPIDTIINKAIGSSTVSGLSSLGYFQSIVLV